MILAFYFHLLVISCSVMFSVTQYLGPQQEEEKQIAFLEQILLGRLKAIIERKTQQDMTIFDELNTKFSDQIFVMQNLSKFLSSTVNNWKQQISDLKLLVEGQTSPKADPRNISRHMSSTEDLSSNNWNQQISDLQLLVQEQKTAIDNLRTQIIASNGWNQQISDLKRLVQGHTSSIEDLSSNNWNQQISDLQLLVQEQKTAIDNLRTQIIASNGWNEQISDLKLLAQEQKTAIDNLRTQINAFNGWNQQISDLKRLVEGHTSSIEDLSSNNWNQQISDLQLLVQEQKTALRTQIIASNDLNQQISDLKLLVQEQKTAVDNLRTQINPFSRVRLIGPFLLEGRVEIYHNGEWGTVCDDYWEDVDASVVCKELGFRNGYARDDAHYGEGTGKIWMDNVECTGNETRLAECSFNGWNDENCDHDEDAGVRCN